MSELGGEVSGRYREYHTQNGVSWSHEIYNSIRTLEIGLEEVQLEYQMYRKRVEALVEKHVDAIGT